MHCLCRGASCGGGGGGDSHAVVSTRINNPCSRYPERRPQVFADCSCLVGRSCCLTSRERRARGRVSPELTFSVGVEDDGKAVLITIVHSTMFRRDIEANTMRFWRRDITGKRKETGVLYFGESKRRGDAWVPHGHGMIFPSELRELL